MLDQLLDFLDQGDPTLLVEQITGVLAATPPQAIERATGLYIWKRAWESALPASRHGGDRRSTAWRGRDQDEKISFSSVAAERLGVSERAIQLDVQLIEQLGPDAVRRLWSSPIADNAAALKTVAVLDEVGRKSLFSIWSDNPRLGFTAALTAAKLRVAQDGEEVQFRKLVDDWSRSGSKARARFLAEIGFEDADARPVIRRWQKRGAQ